MKILATSDLHGNLPTIPSDADALIIAGDICPDFVGNGSVHQRDGWRQAKWLRKEFVPWLPDLPVIMIWGNHDFVGMRPDLWRPALEHAPSSLVIHQDSWAYFQGLRVYGTPWVPGLPYWAFYASEPALQARAELIPEGLDILISHGPPLGWGDYIPTSEKQRNKYGNYGGEHVGDRALRERIERVKPRLTICGHIHEARGAWAAGSVLNVAAVDAAYNLHSNPWVQLHALER